MIDTTDTKNMKRMNGMIIIKKDIVQKKIERGIQRRIVMKKGKKGMRKVKVKSMKEKTNIRRKMISIRIGTLEINIKDRNMKKTIEKDRKIGEDNRINVNYGYKYF